MSPEFSPPQRQLIDKLGLIAIAEKHLPRIFDDSHYEAVLDDLRDSVNAHQTIEHLDDLWELEI